MRKLFGSQSFHCVHHELHFRKLPNHEAVHRRQRKGQRPHEVNEKNHAIRIGVIPCFVVVTVVEDQASPLLPRVNLISNSNSAARTGRWNDQSQVVAQQTFVRSPMRRDLRFRREDGEHGHFQPGYLGNDACGFRATGAILLDLVTEAVEEEALPAVAVRNRTLLGGDILQVWNVFFMLQQ